MTKEELKKLDCFCNITKMPQSEVIQAGIEQIYTDLDKLTKKQEGAEVPTKKVR